MKKLLLLTMAVLTLSLPARAADGDEFIVDNLKYTVLSEAAHTVSLIGYVSEPAGEVIIPSKVSNAGTDYMVTMLGTDAFHSCKNLTSVIIPNSVTEIAHAVFYDCESLVSVYIPNSVTKIGELVFCVCSFTSFEIPNSVTEIGRYTFSRCYNLSSISIPTSIRSIAKGLFANCTSLTSIDIPDSVTEIGQNAFGGCTGLTSINIPNSVTEIGSTAFRECTSLTSIVIPNSVTRIKDWTFGECTSLSSVKIPESMWIIDRNAFSSCKSLTRLYSYVAYPPIAYYETFAEVPADAVVYVPKGCIDVYSAAEGWNRFSDFREMDSGIDEVEVDGADGPVEYYNLGGVRVSGDALVPGVYIKRQGAEASKVIVK